MSIERMIMSLLFPISLPLSTAFSQVGPYEPYDVVVAITPQAQQYFEDMSSGTTFEEEIQLVFDEANAGLSASYTGIRYNLVHIEVISIDEDGYAYKSTFETIEEDANDFDIENIFESSLENSADFTAVNSAKALLGADLVTTIIHSDNPDLGGLASGLSATYYSAQNSGTINWGDYCYSVLEAIAVTGQYVAGHELGHNLGAGHGTVNEIDEVGLFSYSQGHHFEFYSSGTRFGFSTVMAYPNSSFPYRYNAYSNPDLSLNYEDNGQQIIEPLGIENLKDNVRTFEDTHLNLIGMGASYVFSQAQVYDDYWRVADTLGWIEVAGFPWIWSTDHGWLYAAYESEDNLFVYDPAISGWFWTSRNHWPDMYFYGSYNRWMRFGGGTAGSPRWFYDYTNSAWITIGTTVGNQPSYEPTPIY
jgi:hypothetical protein